MGRVAAKIPMSLSAFSRGVSDGTLSVENCLRLADAVGDDPGKILRLGGKQSIAAVVDRLTAKTNETLSRRWVTFAKQLQGADPDSQDVFEMLLRIVVNKQRELGAAPTFDDSAPLHPLEVYRLARGLSFGALAQKISAAAGFPRSADCIRKICLGQTRAQGPTAWAVDKFLSDEKAGE